MSTLSTECSNVADPSAATSRTRQSLTDLLFVSAFCVVSAIVVRVLVWWVTSQRSVSPRWNR